MVSYTNKHNLAPYLFDWLKHDPYDHNKDEYTLSTTTLLKPVRVHWLSQRNGDKLSIDVVDLIASRLGTAIHDSIEQVKTANVYKEQRVSKKIVIDNQEYTITGKYDILCHEDGKWFLRDIKTTSVWAYIYGGKDDDYKKQLSIYRWLLSDVHKLEDHAFIDMIFTDWQSSKAKTEDNYPPLRIMSGYRIELMSLEETEAFIRNRLVQFFMYKDYPEPMLPYCNKEELWATEDTYAIMKKDAKRATKVCNTKEEAETYMAEKNLKDSWIEFRQGKAKRCTYCPNADVNICSQYKELLKRNLIQHS